MKPESPISVSKCTKSHILHFTRTGAYKTAKNILPFLKKLPAFCPKTLKVLGQKAGSFFVYV